MYLRTEEEIKPSIVIEEKEKPLERELIQQPHHEEQKTDSSEDKNEEQESGGSDKPKKISPLMKNFVKQMRDGNTGVVIKDREWRVSETSFTTYNRCFVGTELVDWLMKNKNLQERDHAVKIGQKLLTVGLFHHVTDSSPFLDGFYFYRFKEDD